MPLTLLKIDRSLVVRTVYSSSDRILVTAVVSTANALGPKVVAEGVESAEPFIIVRELGCDDAQGHPRPHDEVDAPGPARAGTAPSSAPADASPEQDVTHRRERLAE